MIDNVNKRSNFPAGQSKTKVSTEIKESKKEAKEKISFQEPEHLGGFQLLTWISRLKLIKLNYSTITSI